MRGIDIIKQKYMDLFLYFSRDNNEEKQADFSKCHLKISIYLRKNFLFKMKIDN